MHCSFMDREEAHVGETKEWKMHFGRTLTEALCASKHLILIKQLGQCRALALLVEVQHFISVRWECGRGTKWFKRKEELISHPLIWFLLLWSCPAFFSSLTLHCLASFLLVFTFSSHSLVRPSHPLQSTNTADLVKASEERRSRKWAAWQSLPANVLTLATGVAEMTPLLLCKVKAGDAAATGFAPTYLLKVC